MDYEAYLNRGPSLLTRPFKNDRGGSGYGEGENVIANRWDVSRVLAGVGVKEDDQKLANLLAAGWEPFAVTSHNGAGYVYHLRIKRRISYDANTAGD